LTKLISLAALEKENTFRKAAEHRGEMWHENRSCTSWAFRAHLPWNMLSVSFEHAQAQCTFEK